MLRAQAFESLFTLVPIILVAVVSIALRVRASRRRKQREQAAEGEPVRGASAGGAAARRVPGRGARTQGAPAQDMRAPGARTQDTPAGSQGTRDEETTGFPVSTRMARSVRSTKAARFPWQRETSEIYTKRSSKTPSAAAPFAPRHQRRSPVTGRESYAYPPPLFPEQAGPEPAVGAGPGSPAFPRQVVRPSVESRMAVDRMAPPGEAKTLPPRKRAPDEPGWPSPKDATRKGPSISARLERLPPLKRAVIWAEILGPPGGRQ